MRFFNIVSALCIVITLIACATGRQHVNAADPIIPGLAGQPILTLYGVGDAGEHDDQSGAVIRHLAGEAIDDNHHGFIFFLGDNVYPEGLAEPGHEEHAYGVALLNKQISMLSGCDQEIIFIPGNHDWKEGKDGALAAIKRQSDFINHHGEPNMSFRPSAGCGDPVFLSPAPGVQVIIIDSQWWIQDWTGQPGMNQGCTVQSREQLIGMIKENIDLHPDNQLVFVMHHPMESQGPHGGHYTFRDHMFPLSKVVKWLYLPLPVIGSIYPWYRTVFGHPQDLKNKRYHSLQTALYDITEGRKDVIFLAGHDHSLQYIEKDDRHVVISGAGSKQNAIADHPNLRYGHKAPGYVVLDFYETKEVVLTIFEVDPVLGSGEIVFRKEIMK